MNSTIEISMGALTKRYGDVTAVDSLDLIIYKGEIFGLLGPNGAGKTTTLNILCGLVRPTSGRAVVCGSDLGTDPFEVKKAIGVATQSTSIYSHLTGIENVMLLGELHGLDRAGAKKRALALLEKLGLTEDASRRAGDYREGMKRRLSLAMALIGDPQVAFLDEPTAAMDPQSRRAVWDFVRDIKASGRTAILTTHYIEEAEELCDRVGIIDHGRLIALGRPNELVTDYAKRDLEEVFIHLTGRKIREEF
jgi:ABC-type multidrug transport system ATPase subunit